MFLMYQSTSCGLFQYIYLLSEQIRYSKSFETLIKVNVDTLTYKITHMYKHFHVTSPSTSVALGHRRIPCSTLSEFLCCNSNLRIDWMLLAHKYYLNHYSYLSTSKIACTPNIHIESL